MSKKDSFILYISQLRDVCDSFTDEEAGQLFKAIILHELNREEPGHALPAFSDRAVSLFFNQVANALDNNAEKWEEQRKRRAAAGKIGGIKSGETRRATKQNEANEANASFFSENEAGEELRANSGGDDPAPGGSVDYYGVYNNVELTPEQYEIIKTRVENYPERINKVSQGIRDGWKGYQGKNHFDLILKFASMDGYIKGNATNLRSQMSIARAEYNQLKERLKARGISETDIQRALNGYGIIISDQSSPHVAELIQSACVDL